MRKILFHRTTVRLAAVFAAVAALGAPKKW